ncbi:transposase, partial [Photorhabdus sp. RM157S]
LHDYLKPVGERTAFIVSDILDEQDWAPFERDYASSGRAPYSPRSMMGILLDGLMKGSRSLRGLERLARLDLGCLFVSHGMTPEHASLGRFIYQHQSTLTGSFFEGGASSVLHHSQSGCTQAKKGRKIKRYREDEARDKLRSRMTKPESKRILSQRKVMVEPVFSALRGIQGLERFRRRG